MKFSTCLTKNKTIPFIKITGMVKIDVVVFARLLTYVLLVLVLSLYWCICVNLYWCICVACIKFVLGYIYVWLVLSLYWCICVACIKFVLVYMCGLY